MRFKLQILICLALFFCSINMSGQNEIETFKLKVKRKKCTDVKKINFILYSDSTYLITGLYCVKNFEKKKEWKKNNRFEGRGTFKMVDGKYIWYQNGIKTGGIKYSGGDSIIWGELILRRK